MTPKLRRFRLFAAPLVLGLPFTFCARDGPSEDQSPRPAADLNRVYHSAVAHYQSEQYRDALKELKILVASLPDSFEVNELMGLVYAAQGQDEKASPFFEKAARLNPQSANARTNFAINLLRLRKDSLAEAEFKKAVELQPGDFDANRNLGDFYLHDGKVSLAIPYLKKAQFLDPSSYPNAYNLALAYLEAQKLAEARAQVQAIVKQQDTAELHSLRGEVEEKAGNFVEAAHEYERAAQMDPSENYIFGWGVELLLHWTLQPAIKVFASGVERYPGSAKLQVGLGIARYANEDYDEAIKAFILATDLEPSDPRLYLLLARTYNASSSREGDEVTRRLRRFVQFQPGNALANYYCALSLRKAARAENRPEDLNEIESLLRNAITLDPRLAEAHLGLGVLYADQRKYPEAIREYQQAVKLQPDLPEARWRLGQAYARTGEKIRAREEFTLYDALHKKQVAEAEAQREQVRQFIYTMKESPQPKIQ